MKPKFLIIDDDADMRSIIEAMLNSLDCEAIAVDSGEKALQILSEEEKVKEFDAVFLDVLMPGMNGLQVLDELKQRPLTSHLPIILLTCQNKGDEMMAGYTRGADYYITKPFTKEQIVYGLDIVLGGTNDSA